MKIQHLWPRSLAVLTTALLLIGSNAYAGSDPFDQFKDFNAHRDQVEAQLAIDRQADTYPHATSYYDDKEAHYEQVLIMKDEIDKGIR